MVQVQSEVGNWVGLSVVHLGDRIDIAKLFPSQFSKRVLTYWNYLKMGYG